MRSTHRKAPKSENVYLQVLVKLYRFLARMNPLSTPDSRLRRRLWRKLLGLETDLEIPDRPH